MQEITVALLHKAGLECAAPEAEEAQAVPASHTLGIQPLPQGGSVASLQDSALGTETATPDAPS